MSDIGIDQINLYVCPAELESKTLQAHKNISDKEMQDVGFVSHSIVPCYEDVVTQSVNAALPIIKGHEHEYNLVIVATESGFDFGKAISTYVQSYLNLSINCNNIELKHACYSGTAALKMACAWAAFQPEGKKVLVIMTDIARSHIDDPAELTVGSGAVALSISKNPRILKLDLNSGVAAKEIYDVARPTKTMEYGDATLSLMSYLDMTEAAWINFKEHHPVENIQDYFAYMLFHTPLVSLIKNAHQVIMEEATNCDKQQIAADFETRVLPPIWLNLYLGNMLSASIYAALIGLILRLDGNLTKPISISSYGSGSCAEFYQAHIVNNAVNMIKPLRIEEMIKSRQSVEFTTYRDMVKEQDKVAMAENYTPDYNQVPNLYEKYYKGQGRLVLDRIEHYHRIYKLS